MAKSLNKVTLLGNVTKDPDLRYTPNGAAVASFSIATNRSYTLDSGEKRDEVEYHPIVAWKKLAEICEKYLKKGAKVYVEGRMVTRKWEKDGIERQKTEVVIDDMIMLGSKKDES